MKLPLKRHSARGRSGPMSVTATRAAVAAAHRAMLAAPWTPCGGQASDLPPHKWAQSGFRDEYDAFMFGGDYAADDAQCVQRAYCGAVSYSAPVPPDALSGAACSLASVTLRAFGDRWLAQGARLDLFLTASPAPPALADIESGAAVPAATTGDPADADAASPAYPPPFQKVARSNSGADPDATVTLPVGAALSAATAYVHLVLRLGDYEHTTLTDAGAVSAWIEGGAALSGASADFAFSRAVAAAAVEPRSTSPCVATEFPVREASDNFAAYAYRPYVFDIDVAENHRDLHGHFGFPLAGAIRRTALNLGYDADDARPFAAPAAGCFCGVCPYGPRLLGASSTSLTREGAYSGVQLSTFATGGRRFAAATVRITPVRLTMAELGDESSGERALSASEAVAVRLDLYALPWPLLVFPAPLPADAVVPAGQPPGKYMDFARFLDLSTLCDPAFLSGAATELAFIDDAGFPAERLSYNDGTHSGHVYPLYNRAELTYPPDDPDTEGVDESGSPVQTGAEHRLWHSSTFPCVPVATAEIFVQGDGTASHFDQTVAFPAPLATDARAVLLAHFRPARPMPADASAGWRAGCALTSISEG